MTSEFETACAEAMRDPEAFWAEAAGAVDWDRAWDRVLDRADPAAPHWFAGARLNTCFNALDRHVAAGRGEQTALIYESPVTGASRIYTFAQLRDETARLAGALTGLGVGKGDRVILYMPMIPQAVIGMLACARLGAIHSVVFGGFAPRELAVRIDDARPRVILTASCGVEPGRIVPYKPMVDEAMALAAHKPERVFVVQRPELRAELDPARDLDWDDAVAGAPAAPCQPVAATDPLYILYTSGTTGRPKGVVRDNGGHATALLWSMRRLYGMRPGEVFWAASDVGWVVGHSYIVYGPLLHGCATVLFEGKPVGTPDAAAYWRVIARHKVSVLFTAPTALRAIRREDPEAALAGDHDLRSLRTLFLAGERSDPDTLAWARERLGVPVIDHWWQTETGWAICGNPQGFAPLPVKPGSTARPMPGWDVQALGPDGAPVPTGQVGALCLKLPLPPGALLTLWGADERYRTSYLGRFPGFYETGDAGFIDADGYVHVMARTDDIINVAGHRLSTGAMEEVVATHPAVAECAVIGVADALKGQRPLGLIVLKRGVEQAHASIVAEVVQSVRERIGPVADFKRAVVVDRLPKTRSGKILRGVMQKIADGETYAAPATIDDPAILGEIEQALGRRGPDPA